MILASETVTAISRDGLGREDAAANELIGIVAGLARHIDDADSRTVIAWSLLQLAAQLDSALKLNVH